MLELTGLNNRVAIVTGAGRLRSIGRAIALAMARAGADVVVTGTGRDPSTFPKEEKEIGWRDIESVADEIRALGVKALPVVSDVGSESDIAKLHETVVSELGRVDFVVNNAAAPRGRDRAPVLDMPLDAWDLVMRVNVRGPFMMSQTFGRQMKSQGEGGSIVNISSVAGKQFPATAGAYASSKAALQALTACMAQEVAADGIRVNAICVGFVDTHRMDKKPSEASPHFPPLGEIWDMLLERTPLGYASNGDEIGHMSAFLCSDQGKWITGQAINVDGGMSVEH